MLKRAFSGMGMFPGHEANPQNGKAKTVQVSVRGCGCSVERGHTWVWQAVGEEEMD